MNNSEQHFESDAESIFLGQLWTTSKAYSYLTDLCNFGSRFGGTESEEKAKNYLVQKYKDAGLTNVQLLPVEYVSWTRGKCSLSIVDSEELKLSPIALVYSPSTPDEGLVKECVYVGMGREEDYETQKDFIPGKIVIASSQSPPGIHIHRRAKYGRAVRYGASAFIFVNHNSGMLPVTGSLRKGQMAEIPAISVSKEDGWKIIAKVRDENAKLLLQTTNTSQKNTAYHVWGELESTETNLSTQGSILIGAHYDGHDISQGASDNAASVASMLDLARVISQFPRGRKLIFCSFAIEELGVLGSSLMLETYPDLIEKHKIELMLNLDGIIGGFSKILVLNGFKELISPLVSISNKIGYPFELTENIITACDSFTFFLKGVPSISLFAIKPRPELGRGYGHTAADTIDKVDSFELTLTTMIIGRFVWHLREYPHLASFLTKEEVRKLLVDKGIDISLKAQGLWTEIDEKLTS